MTDFEGRCITSSGACYEFVEGKVRRLSESPLRSMGRNEFLYGRGLNYEEVESIHPNPPQVGRGLFITTSTGWMASTPIKTIEPLS